MSSLSTLSSRFAFFTRWFRRHDEHDAQSTQDAQEMREPRQSLNEAGDEYHFDASPQRDDAPVNGNGSGHGDGDGHGDDDPRESRRPLIRRRDSHSRDRSIAQLQQAYEEVIELVGTLKQHMEAQSERSERLLTMMEGLPEALKSLPEANRNQTQTLQVIEGHLKQQNQQSEGLTQAIQGLAKAAGNQEQAMNVIQQQLDAGQESREHLHQNFGALSETLGHMSETNQATTQLLNRLNEKHEHSDAEMQRLVARNQRQMTMMSVVSWSLAIVALTVAGAVAVWVGQQMSGPAGGEPSSAPQAAGLVQPQDTGASEHAAASIDIPAAALDAAAQSADDESEPMIDSPVMDADAAELEAMEAMLDDLGTSAAHQFERLELPWASQLNPYAALLGSANAANEPDADAGE